MNLQHPSAMIEDETSQAARKPVHTLHYSMCNSCAAQRAFTDWAGHTTPTTRDLIVYLQVHLLLRVSRGQPNYFTQYFFLFPSSWTFGNLPGQPCSSIPRL